MEQRKHKQTARQQQRWGLGAKLKVKASTAGYGCSSNQAQMHRFSLSICNTSYTEVNCQLRIYKLSYYVNFAKYVETVGVREGWVVSL